MSVLNFWIGWDLTVFSDKSIHHTRGPGFLYQENWSIGPITRHSSKLLQSRCITGSPGESIACLRVTVELVLDLYVASYRTGSCSKHLQGARIMAWSSGKYTFEEVSTHCCNCGLQNLFFYYSNSHLFVVLRPKFIYIYILTRTLHKNRIF